MPLLALSPLQFSRITNHMVHENGNAVAIHDLHFTGHHKSPPFFFSLVHTPSLDKEEMLRAKHVERGASSTNEDESF